MNEEYIIIDARPLNEFKDSTFSGFKKRDVINTLYKNIELGKVEESCYWITECIISGYTIEIYDKLVQLSSKIIHINSPNLPEFIWRRYKTFHNSINHIGKREKDKYIHLRNTESVRNNLIDLIVTMTISPKTKRYDKYPKIDESKDFQFVMIKEKLNATMNLLPSHIIKFTDPEELRIIMNEIFFNLKNQLGGYDRCIYWVLWLIKWEKKNKKDKKKYEIEERTISGVHKKYCKDIIWLVWNIILEETLLRDDNIKKQIQSLYNLFRYEYTGGKRNSRLPIIYHSIGYLTLPINFKVEIRKNKNTFIQTQCNINMMFKGKKIKEQKKYTAPPQKNKKIIGINKEISNDKMNIIQQMDELL